jgi:hypothetical protein
MQIEQFMAMHPDDRHKWWEAELHRNGGPHGPNHDALAEAAKGNPAAEQAVHRARHGHVPDALDAFMKMHPDRRAAYVYDATHAEMKDLEASIAHALPPDPDPDYATRVAQGRTALRPRRADPALWRERFKDAIHAAYAAAEKRLEQQARAVADQARADFIAAYHQRKRPSA